MISIARRTRSHSYGPQLNLPTLNRQSKKQSKNAKKPNLFIRKNFSRFARNLENTFKTNIFKPKKDLSKAERFFRKKKKEKTNILDLKFGSKEFFEEARRLEKVQKLFGKREIVDYRHKSRSIYPEEQQQRLLNSSTSSSGDDKSAQKSNIEKEDTHHLQFLDKQRGNRYFNTSVNRRFTNNFNKDYFKSVQEKMRLDYLRKKAESELEQEEEKNKRKGKRSKSNFVRRHRMPSITVMDADSSTNHPLVPGKGFIKSDKHIIMRRKRGGNAQNINSNFPKSFENIPSSDKEVQRSRKIAKRKKFLRQNIKKYQKNGKSELKKRTLSSPFIDLMLLNESSRTFDLVDELQNFLKEEEEKQKDAKGEAKEPKRDTIGENDRSSANRTFIFKVKKRKKRRGNKIRRER